MRAGGGRVEQEVDPAGVRGLALRLARNREAALGVHLPRVKRTDVMGFRRLRATPSHGVFNRAARIQARQPVDPRLQRLQHEGLHLDSA